MGKVLEVKAVIDLEWAGYESEDQLLDELSRSGWVVEDSQVIADD